MHAPLVILSIIAGVHVPVIPFGEVSAKIGGTEPVQNGGITAKFGTVGMLTVVLRV